jgi:hypothetical protein
MTLKEEIESLERNPLAQRLLDIMSSEDGPRTCQLLSELTSLVEEENAK